VNFQDFFNKILCSLVAAGFVANPCILKDEAFTKGLCKRLYIFINFIHPHIKKLLLLIHYLFLHLFSKCADLNFFSDKNKVPKYGQVEISCRLNLLKSLLTNVRYIMLLALSMCEDIFDNFLHEYFVISFCCHC